MSVKLKVWPICNSAEQELRNQNEGLNDITTNEKIQTTQQEDT